MVTDVFFDKNYHSIKDMFLRFGIKSVSMDDIASILKISKKTLYEHFGTKENLLSLILDRFIKEEKQIIQKIAKNNNALDGLFSFLSHIMDTLGTLSDSTLYDLQKFYPSLYKTVEDYRSESVLSNITYYLEAGKTQVYIRKKLCIEDQAELFLLMITSILETDSSKPMEKRITLFKTFCRTQLRGMTTDKGSKKLESYEF